MEIIGLIRAINPTEQVSTNFKKREFVVTTEPTTPYPQHILIQFTQDKCAILDSYFVGEEVKVQINLKGREHNGAKGVRYYVTIEAWRIEKTAPKF